MIAKRAAVVGLLAVGIGLSAVSVASADAGSGGTTTVIGSGQVDHSFKVQQKKGNDVVTTQMTFEVDGFSGWHSHPGLAMIVVQSGEITLYREKVAGGPCRVRTYSAGQVFLERPGDRQNAINHGAAPVVVAVTFFNVPHAGVVRIDGTNPNNCPI